MIRFRDNTAQKVMISKGQAMGTYVEVSGDLRNDDEVALIAAAHSPSHGPVRRRLIDETEVEKELSLKNEH